MTVHGSDDVVLKSMNLALKTSSARGKAPLRPNPGGSSDNSQASGCVCSFFFFQAEDGIRDVAVTGVQTCALPILDRCGNVICILRCDREDARFREPCIYPSQGLRQAWMLADVVRVLDICNQVLARGTVRVFDARVNRKLHRNQISVKRVVEPFPRRFGRPVCIRRTPPAKSLARKKARRPELQKRGHARSLQKCSSVHVATNPPSHSTKESLATSVHFSQFYLRGARLLPFSDRLVFSVELCTPLQMTTVSHLRGPHSTMRPRGRKGFVQPGDPAKLGEATVRRMRPYWERQPEGNSTSHAPPPRGRGDPRSE